MSGFKKRGCNSARDIFERHGWNTLVVKRKGTKLITKLYHQGTYLGTAQGKEPFLERVP
jgi:hypothetical protein